MLICLHGLDSTNSPFLFPFPLALLYWKTFNEANHLFSTVPTVSGPKTKSLLIIKRKKGSVVLPQDIFQESFLVLKWYILHSGVLLLVVTSKAWNRIPWALYLSSEKAFGEWIIHQMIHLPWWTLNISPLIVSSRAVQQGTLCRPEIGSQVNCKLRFCVVKLNFGQLLSFLWSIVLVCTTREWHY